MVGVSEIHKLSAEQSIKQQQRMAITLHIVNKEGAHNTK